MNLTPQALPQTFERSLTISVAVTAEAVASESVFVCSGALPEETCYELIIKLARGGYRSDPSSAPGCICSDECSDAPEDGYCDDGGPGSEYNRCPLGHDCRDCGPRVRDGSSGDICIEASRKDFVCPGKDCTRIGFPDTNSDEEPACRVSAGSSDWVPKRETPRYWGKPDEQCQEVPVVRDCTDLTPLPDCLHSCHSSKDFAKSHAWLPLFGRCSNLRR